MYMINQNYNTNNQHILLEGLVDCSSFKSLTPRLQDYFKKYTPYSDLSTSLIPYQKACEQTSNYNEIRLIVQLWLEYQNTNYTSTMKEVFQNNFNDKNLNLLVKWLEEAGFDQNNIFLNFFVKFKELYSKYANSPKVPWRYNQLVIINNLVSENYITTQDVFIEKDIKTVPLIFCKGLYDNSYNDIKQYLNIYAEFNSRNILNKQSFERIKEDLSKNSLNAPTIAGNLNMIKRDVSNDIPLSWFFYKNTHCGNGVVPLSDIVYVYNFLKNSRSKETIRQETKEVQDKSKKNAMNFLKYVSKGKMDDAELSKLYTEFTNYMRDIGGRR